MHTQYKTLAMLSSKSNPREKICLPGTSFKWEHLKVLTFNTPPVPPPTHTGVNKLRKEAQTRHFWQELTGT